MGIIGNEKADFAAKFASYAPIITNNILEKNDIRHRIRNHVRDIFKQKPLTQTIQNYHPIYPTDIGNKKIKIFSRLRLGHFLGMAPAKTNVYTLH